MTELEQGARERMNDSRTCIEIDAHLTQARSRSVPMTDFTATRSMLKKLAMEHGADTAIGRACHNLLEMTENFAKSSDDGQKAQLAANIQRELGRLEDLKKSVSQ